MDEVEERRRHELASIRLREAVFFVTGHRRYLIRFDQCSPTAGRILFLVKTPVLPARLAPQSADFSVQGNMLVL